MMRWSKVGAGVFLLTLAALAASAASPKRVLILNPFGRDVAPFNAAVSAFRTTLAQELGGPVDFYEVPLELARFAESEGESPLVTFLEGRINSQPVDLVVPIGGAGVQFAARHRERLFPDTRVLAVAPEPRFVTPGLLGTNATLVTQKVNLPGMVEDILYLQPQTTNIVVVFGASALERFWVNECRREFQAFTNRVGFTWLNDLPLEQILERCAALPPRSFILHGLFVVDAAGIPCERNQALRRLHTVANAPVFGYFASEIGLGPIGGRLYQDAEVGVRGARTAIRILRGESPGGIPPQVFEATTPVYDWRELQRWGTSKDGLPAGSVIEFRPPAFWARYGWAVAGVILFGLLQTALIIGLLVNRDQRRQGETALRDLSGRLIRAHEAERARLGRELHDDVSQRLARLAIDAGRVARGDDGVSPTETMQSVRDGLVRLSEDIHALSYRLHPSVLEDLGLAEALKAECERFSRQELVPAEVAVRELPGRLPPEAALCLFRVAQEALRNVARHARARRVEVSVRALHGGLQLAVHDDGIGFDPASQRVRPSLGLASMHERVLLLDGKLDIESLPGQGTTILVTVPLKETHPEPPDAGRL